MIFIEIDVPKTLKLIIVYASAKKIIHFVENVHTVNFFLNHTIFQIMKTLILLIPSKE